MRRFTVVIAAVAAAATLTAQAAASPAGGARPARADGPTAATTVCSASHDVEFAAGLSEVVTGAVAQSAKGYPAPVSVAFYDRPRDTVCQAGADQPYYQASTVKVAILAALLRERAAHPSPGCPAGELCGRERAEAEQMIRVSDNAAAVYLYGRLGGPAALRRFVQLLGMAHTAPASAFGETVTTAADQLVLLHALTGPDPALTDAQRGYVLGLMSTVRRTELLWFGVPSEAPAGATVATKIGLNAWRDGKRARVHSIGAVRGPAAGSCPGQDYMMALLSQHNASFVSGAQRLSRVGAAINRYLAAHPPVCASQSQPPAAPPSSPPR